MTFLRRCVLSASLCAVASTATTARADEPPRNEAADEEARVHFAAGVNLLRDPARPRYEEAYVEFKKAYALAASPKILGNLGLCAMKLERDAEAIDAFARYLAEVPDMSAEERAQVERDLATLKATLATITIESRPSGASLVDTRIPVQGEPITNMYGTISGRTPLALRKGHHVLKARFEDGRELSWEANIEGGESHVFELPRDPAPAAPTTSEPPVPARARPTEQATERPVPSSVYAAGAVTAALGVGSLVTGLVALDTNARFDERNDGYDLARAEDLRQTGTTLNVVSDALLVGTVAAAAVTAYLYLSRPSVPKVGATSPGAKHVAGALPRAPFVVRF